MDIGCGDGRSTAYLSDNLPHCSITGCDYSDRALALASLMSGQSKISWNNVNLYEPETSNETYDVITAIEVFEHIPPERLPVTLVNVRSMLRPGGSLLITVPSSLLPQSKKHYQHFTPDGIRMMLAGAGFEVQHLAGQQRHGHPLFHLYRLFENRYWLIKPLAAWFNRAIYPKYISPSEPEHADRLIVKAVRA